jgi:hypothetical protein
MNLSNRRRFSHFVFIYGTATIKEKAPILAEKNDSRFPFNCSSESWTPQSGHSLATQNIKSKKKKARLWVHDSTFLISLSTVRTANRALRVTKCESGTVKREKKRVCRFIFLFLILTQYKENEMEKEKCGRKGGSSSHTQWLVYDQENLSSPPFFFSLCLLLATTSK